MIRHIVLWRLKEKAEGRSKQENARIMKEKFEAMQPEISCIRRLEVGLDEFHAADSWDISLTIDFDTMEDQKAYQSHPAHQRVVEFVRKARELRAVIDYPV